MRDAVNQSFDDVEKVFGKLGPSIRLGHRALVHIERAIDFDLDGVAAARRRAIMLCDEAARIGLVATHGITELAQRAFQRLDDPESGAAPSATLDGME